MSFHEPTDREKGFRGQLPNNNTDMNEYRAGQNMRNALPQRQAPEVDADGLALSIVLVAAILAPIATGWIAWTIAPHLLPVIAISYAVMVLLLRFVLPVAADDGATRRLSWARAAQCAAFAWLLGWLAVSLAWLAAEILIAMRGPQIMPVLENRGSNYGLTGDDVGYYLVTSSALNWVTAVVAWTAAAWWGLNAKLPALRANLPRALVICGLVLIALAAGIAAGTA